VCDPSVFGPYQKVEIMVWSQMTRLHCVVLAQNRPVRGGITAYLAYENFNPINSFSLNSKYYNNLFLCVFNVWTKSSRRFKQESATDTARIKKYRNTLRSSMTPFYLFNFWTLQSLRIHCLQKLSTNALVAFVPRQLRVVGDSGVSWLVCADRIQFITS
jgi:hypothetical protein